MKATISDATWSIGHYTNEQLEAMSEAEYDAARASVEGCPDPRDEHPFTIKHPASGDEAQADTIEAARAAALQLERDHGIAGSRRAMIFHNPTKKEDE